MIRLFDPSKLIKMRRILLIGFFLVLATMNIMAKKDQHQTGDSDDVEVINTGDSEYLELEWPQYAPWKVVSIDGKLKMNGLPLSPTVKIFMEKDKLVSLSLRAPFFGEVGRLDLTPDTITIVNKMNKTYVQENIAGKGIVGGKILGLNEVQSLLLGRFFLPGNDINTANLEDLVEIFYEDDQINVLPKGEAEIEKVKYGFAVNEQFIPKLLVVVPRDSEKTDIEVSVEYDWKASGYDILFAYGEGNRNYEMRFELKKPEWKGDGPKEMDLGSKYKKVSFEDFLKNIG